MKFIQSTLALLLTLLVFTATAHAAELPTSSSPYLITPSFKVNSSIGLHQDLYEDKKSTLSIDDAIALARSGKFRLSTLREHSLGNTDSVWWTHLTLINKTDSSQELILNQGYPHIDDLKLWELIDGSLILRKSGDMLPFSEREIEINALPFVLQLQANSHHTVFLRYQTSGVLSIDLSLYSPIAFAESMVKKQSVQGLFYGALFALGLYNLFIFFIVRDLSYMYYVAYILSFGLFIAGFSGYSAQYLWPESPWFSNKSLLFFWGSTIATSLLFSKSFLNLRLYSPRINFAANILVSIALISAVGAFMFYGTVIKVLFMLAPPAYLLILIAAYTGIRRGYTPARYFMIAWATLMVAGITSTLFSAGIIDKYASESLYIIEFGAFIELILLSIALASRIRNLEQESLTDSLTQLYNRRFFDRQLLRLTELSQRQREPLSLLIVDIDHFKQFNDNYGHRVGDTVLQQVGLTLLKAGRQTDYVCRYGGEEFAILLPNTGQDNAIEIAERTRKLISQLNIKKNQVTVSIGLATINEIEETNVSDLVKNADKALYQAKNSGRNRVESFIDYTA